MKLGVDATRCAKMWRRLGWLFYEVIADKLTAETKVLTAARSDAIRQGVELVNLIQYLTRHNYSIDRQTKPIGVEQIPAMGKQGGPCRITDALTIGSGIAGPGDDPCDD